DNACEQHPPGNGVEAIVHEASLLLSGSREVDLRASYGRVLANSSGLPHAEDELSCAAVEGRQAGLAEPAERLPPAVALRVRVRYDVQVEGEVREDVAHGADWVDGIGRHTGPIAARQRGHSAKQPFRRTTYEPDVSTALRPPSNTVPMR